MLEYLQKSKGELFEPAKLSFKGEGKIYKDTFKHPRMIK